MRSRGRRPRPGSVGTPGLYVSQHVRAHVAGLFWAKRKRVHLWTRCTLEKPCGLNPKGGFTILRRVQRLSTFTITERTFRVKPLIFRTCVRCHGLPLYLVVCSYQHTEKSPEAEARAPTAPGVPGRAPCRRPEDVTPSHVGQWQTCPLAASSHRGAKPAPPAGGKTPRGGAQSAHSRRATAERERAQAPPRGEEAGGNGGRGGPAGQARPGGGGKGRRSRRR